MRQKRLLRGTSTHSLCIFCASRLAGDLLSSLALTPLAISRRRLNTARPSYQSSTPTPAPAGSNGQAEPAWSGFGLDSSLTPSEQREKTLLRQRREHAEKTRLEAMRPQLREREDARRTGDVWEQTREYLVRTAQSPKPAGIQAAQARDPQDIIDAKVSQRQVPSQRQQGQEIDEGASRPTSPKRAESQSRRVILPQRVVNGKKGSTFYHLSDQAGGASRALDHPRSRKDSIPRDQRATSNIPGRTSRSRAQTAKPDQDEKRLSFVRRPRQQGAVVQENPFEKRLSFTPRSFREQTVRGEDPPALDQAFQNYVPVQDGQAQPRQQQTLSSFTLTDLTIQPQQSKRSPAKLVAKPTFRLATQNTNIESRPPADDWAGGAVERAPLVYNDSAPLPSDRVVQQESSLPFDQLWRSTEDTAAASHDQTSQQHGEHADFTNAASTRSRKSLHHFSLKPPSSENFHSGGDNGFRATLIDSLNLQSPPSTSRQVEDHSANWQHLRRRNLNPPLPPPPPPPPQQRRSTWDPQDVDREFEKHLQARPAPVQSRPSALKDLDAVFGAFNPGIKVTDRRCGRCGQVGHIARDCTGPARTRCRICGEFGHSDRFCLSSARLHTAARQVQGPEAASPAFRVFRPMVRAESPGALEQPMKRERVPTSSTRDTWFSPQNERPERVLDDMRSRVRNNGDTTNAAYHMRSAMFEPQEPRTVIAGASIDRTLPRWIEEDARRDKKVRRGRRDDEDEEGNDEAFAARDERNARKAERKAQRQEEKLADERIVKERRASQGPPVNLPDFVSVSHLAQLLGVRYEQFTNTLARLGYDDVFPGKVLNGELSGMIAMEYGFEPIFENTLQEAEDRDLKAAPEPEDTEFLPTRPPVVTIMGHVDHGKTTILDYLRKSSVAAGEAGGITQHIGAFSVPLASSGKTVTFLDTPGHAAFLAMRQRGANVTDIVILVVAADDSVKPQTLEAIKHAKAAGVPMIVAVNKIDKEEADLQRVKQDLSRHGVEIEDFGGDTQVVAVSGKTGQGMDELEENVVTLSEILDHRAETDGIVEGWVLEATTKERGRVATVLVRRGTLKAGTIIVAGHTWTRVRTLRNESGQVIQEAGPGMPVEVDGWRDQPVAGDEVLQSPTEQKANDVVDYRIEKAEREKAAADMDAINEARRLQQEKREREAAAEKAAKYGTSDAYFEAAARQDGEADATAQQATGKTEVPFIIKADVSGSAEAVSAYIQGISSPFIGPLILLSAVGPIRESDIDLASTAKGHIISFNLPADEGMRAHAAAAGVQVLEHNIIYRVLDDVKAVLEERLPPILTQKVLGEAEVAVGFEIGLGGRKKLKIAGCKIRNGVIGRGSRVRILRGQTKVYDGLISSLKNVKKDVQEMRKGTECGIGFDCWEGFEVGDQVQTYEEIREKRIL